MYYTVLYISHTYTHIYINVPIVYYQNSYLFVKAFKNSSLVQFIKN